MAVAAALWTVAPSTATATRRPILAATAFRLPSAAQCVSGRTLTVRLRRVPGVRWRQAIVRIDGKRVKTIAPRQVGKPVTLSRLPQRRFVLSLKAKAADGRTAAARRTYRTCRGQVASQFGALANSPAARAALRDLSKAVSSPAVTSFTKSVVAQYGDQLPVFDKQLIDLASQLASPRDQKLFDAVRAGHRLTRAQAKQLASLKRSINANPAIVQLTAAGRRLQANPAELAAAIKAAIAPPPSQTISSTGDPVFDPAASTLTQALNAAPQKALADQTRKILSGPGAVEYVKSLPPLLLGFLAPQISAQAAAITCRTGPNLIRAKAVVDVASDVTTLLALGIFSAARSILPFWARIGLVGDLFGNIPTYESLVPDIYSAVQTFRPLSLVLCRSGDSIVVGTEQTYTPRATRRSR